MPYIPQNDRAFARECPETPGELNYAITWLLLDYADRQGAITYALLNECIGALECAKLEFARRLVAPYEDVKKAFHGDVYPAHILSK